VLGALPLLTTSVFFQGFFDIAKVVIIHTNMSNISVNKILWNLFHKIWTFDVEHIHLKIIFITKNSNKLAKNKYWKEKSVKNVVTLAGLPFNSSVVSFHI
jgi:hypothetical protein